MFPVKHDSLNQLWARLVVAEMVKHGITDCCIAPGSRNTPLTLALVDEPSITLHRHFDERGLGFLALGLAKAKDQIVAVITTSGTAVANLLPAIIEATQTGVKLFVISADRPPHLHDCGANQSIEQIGIFGVYPRKHVNFLPPSLAVSCREVLVEIEAGLAEIQGCIGGVFHLNMMFDEPLYPTGKVIDFADYVSEVDDYLETDNYRHNQTDYWLPTQAQWQAFCAQDGLLVVGAISPKQTASVLALSELLGWPIVADVQSQLRFDDQVISAADLLLNDEHGLALFEQAQHVLQVGGRLVSKRLQQFIDNHAWQQFWHLSQSSYALVPGRNHHQFVQADIAQWISSLAKTVSHTKAPNEQCGQLIDAQRGIVARVRAAITNQTDLFEVNAVANAIDSMPNNASLFIGNSLSIRLLDMFSLNADKQIDVYANRGASGIDGLIATLSGVAIGGAEGKPLLAILGDTSALYDLNSLALLANIQRPVILMILNNDGGGIFRFLPVPDESTRSDYYQMPHGFTFDKGSEMFGLSYVSPTSPEQLKSAIQQGLQRLGASIIEVKADSAETFAQINALKQSD